MFFYCTLVIIINFHNWYNLQTHRIPCGLPITHLT